MCQQDDGHQDDDQRALRWLMEHAGPGQLAKMAEGLKIIDENGGYGKLTLILRDGRIGDHPVVEISL